MTNREKYDFDCFTLANYASFLKLAKEQGFSFESFQQGYDEKRKIILWRHDVEFSPYTALKMAEIEARLGAKATYFFQVHAETYNLFQRSISDIVHKVKALGHDIGLHFDSHYWGIKDESRLDQCIKTDADYFEKTLGVELKSFTFHCTDDFIKSCTKDSYGGLLNVYSAFFKEKFAYCADSTGFWRYERLHDRLTDHSVHWLQVLTHDAMWSDAVMSPRRRVFAAINERARKTEEWYDATLKIFGAQNIDEDGVL